MAAALLDTTLAPQFDDDDQDDLPALFQSRQGAGAKRELGTIADHQHDTKRARTDDKDDCGEDDDRLFSIEFMNSTNLEMVTNIIANSLKCTSAGNDNVLFDIVMEDEAKREGFVMISSNTDTYPAFTARVGCRNIFLRPDATPEESSFYVSISRFAMLIRGIEAQYMLIIRKNSSENNKVHIVAKNCSPGGMEQSFTVTENMPLTEKEGNYLSDMVFGFQIMIDSGSLRSYIGKAQDLGIKVVRFQMSTLEDGYYSFSIADADEEANDVQFCHTMVVAQTDAHVEKAPPSSNVPVYGPVERRAQGAATVKEQGAFSAIMLNSVLKNMKKQNVSVQFGSFTVNDEVDRKINPLMLEVSLGEMNGWLRFILCSVESTVSSDPLAP